jgi:Sulfotransferase domain
MDTSKVKNAILLIRNPLDVMPSYFKFLYRADEANDPTAEPPVDRWVAWRNENFIEQVTKWVEHTGWWMENYQASGKLMILPFEHFTDPKIGPETLKAIGIFLGRTDPNAASILMPDPSLGCLWNKIIGESSPNLVKGKKKQAAAAAPGGYARYPYTLENLDNLVDALKKLKKDHASVPQLSAALSDYVKKVTTAKRKVEALLAA